VDILLAATFQVHLACPVHAPHSGRRRSWFIYGEWWGSVTFSWNRDEACSIIIWRGCELVDINEYTGAGSGKEGV
jgi:hypothetical protein